MTRRSITASRAREEKRVDAVGFGVMWPMGGRGKDGKERNESEDVDVSGHREEADDGGLYESVGDDEVIW
jgi:hypothetical protein